MTGALWLAEAEKRVVGRWQIDVQVLGKMGK
jgi:hypothetical protein